MSATPTLAPTLACEKLVEQHGYRLSVETLRQWMIAEGSVEAQEAQSSPDSPAAPPPALPGRTGADRWLAT